MKILLLAIQNKILLAILAGVASIVSFQVWKYNQAKYEKFIANKETICKVDLEMGQNVVRRSRILRNLKYNKIVTPGIRQPGGNTNFVKGDTYLLMSPTNTHTLPAETIVYDSIIFKNLLKTRPDPEALLVKAVSMDKQKKQAIVSSDCAPRPFGVLLENLYEKYQTITDDSGYSRPDISF